MSETGLLGFQIAEIGDAVRLTLSGLAFLLGTGMYIRATYFMGDDE